MCFYVYRVTDLRDKTYYYGYRKSKKEDIIEDFWSYCTSSCKKDDIKKYKKTFFKLKILKTFNSKLDALEYESFLHKKFDVKNHPKFFNKSNQTKTFECNTTGLVAAKTKNGYKQISIDEYKNSDFEVFSTNKVVTKEGKQVTKDEFYSLGLEGIRKGKLTVQSSDFEGKWMSIPKEKYNPSIHNKNTKGKVVVYKDGRYFLATKKESHKYDKVLTNKVIVYSIKENKNIAISKDKFYSNTDEYVALSKGRVTVVDKNGNTLSVPKEEAYKYNSLNKNTVTCINLKTKEKLRVPKEEFEEKDYLVGVRTKYLYIKNSKLVHRKDKPNVKIEINSFDYTKLKKGKYD